jgi:hypothetical protein
VEEAAAVKPSKNDWRSNGGLPKPMTVLPVTAPAFSEETPLSVPFWLPRFQQRYPALFEET